MLSECGDINFQRDKMHDLSPKAQKPGGKVLHFFYLLEVSRSSVSWEPATFVAIAPEVSQEPDFYDPLTASGSNRRQALHRLERSIQERIKEIEKEGGQVPKPRFQSLQMYREVEGDTDEDLADVIESGHISL